MVKQNHVYFYHTKRDSDPLNRGKRVTVCAIATDTSVTFGIARSHVVDSKKWNKKYGRMLANGRADVRPILTLEKPKEKVKFFIIEKCKELAYRALLVGKEGKVLTKDDCLEILNRKREALNKEQRDLDNRFEQLVATTTKVNEFFEPNKPKQIEKVLEPVDENSSLAELTH